MIPDAAAYVASRAAVEKALRAARDANAIDVDWLKFIDGLKK